MLIVAACLWPRDHLRWSNIQLGCLTLVVYVYQLWPVQPNPFVQSPKIRTSFNLFLPSACLFLCRTKQYNLWANQKCWCQYLNCMEPSFSIQFLYQPPHTGRLSRPFFAVKLQHFSAIFLQNWAYIFVSSFLADGRKIVQWCHTTLRSGMLLLYGYNQYLILIICVTLKQSTAVWNPLNPY